MNLKLILIISTATAIFFLEGVFPHVRGRTKRIAHAVPHIVIAMINAVLTGLFFAELTSWATGWSKANHAGALRLLPFSGPARYFTAFLLFDLWMYFWHMANHRIPFLWRFHRAHHADTDMDTTTALRFHPGELFLSSVARVPVIVFIGMDFHHLVVFETVLSISTLFHHSNLAVPDKWDRILRALIVTPNMHRVHHSKEQFETNSNFTSLLTVWDRLNRTFRMREDTRTITIGLYSFREIKWQRLWGFLITPFI